jgi:hypothetical protein
VFKWNYLVCTRKDFFTNGSEMLKSLEECRQKSNGHYVGCESLLEEFISTSEEILDKITRNEDGLIENIEKSQLSCRKISHQTRICFQYLSNFRLRYGLEENEYNEKLKTCENLNEQRKECVGSYFCAKLKENYLDCLKSSTFSKKACEEKKGVWEACVEKNDMLIRSSNVIKLEK